MQLNEIHNPEENASVSLKIILLIFAVVLVGALGYFVWQQNTEPTTTDYSGVNLQTTDELAEVPADPCDFSNVKATLTAATTYDILGGENFSTLVCGYIYTREQDMGLGEVDIRNVAYVAVKAFQDAKFKAKIEETISSEGNTVNGKIGSDYLLGCGCLENNEIVASPAPAGGLMSVGDQTKFIASTTDKPVIMKLTYEVHGGSGCNCCTLFEKAEVL